MLIERIRRISSVVAIGCHNSEESCLRAEVQQGVPPKIIIVFCTEAITVVQSVQFARFVESAYQVLDLHEPPTDSTCENLLALCVHDIRR
jgi:hypothetical protein